jgi:hypothetical protein
MTRGITLFLRLTLVLLSTCGVLLPAHAALTNQLTHHPSPYLAMHANDPVAWQDWNAAVMERARREGKLVYLSIGYFSCHWCHVMQRESYQNPEIAKFLNRHFIPVKVDRELEPALDARMIEFVEATRGQGGWPLNVFITPQGHPLFATLYSPPKEFLDVLVKLNELWAKEREGLGRLAQNAAVKSEGPGRPEIDRTKARSYAAAVIKEALAQADDMHGGFGNQSKFPSVPQLDFLLARQSAEPNPKLKEFLSLTLDQMAHGGLNDHLGGGFFRYTVDPSWKTPHFEKMLYDNALLARLYLRAARVLGRPDYAVVARRTLDFMERELRTPAGGFSASLSAVDDKNVEGGYYLWTAEQLAGVLTPEELKLGRLAWSMTDAAPFDAGYLPLRNQSVAEVAAPLQIDPVKLETVLAQAMDKLWRARGQRQLPRDTKLLAGWNGLALSAYAEAARVTKEAKFQQRAQEIRQYLMQRLWDGKALKRAENAGRGLGAAALEDYAYVAEGLLTWARLTGKAEDYAQARIVALSAWKRFYGAHGFRLSEDSLIQAEPGQDAITDGPMPSPSAVLLATSLAIADKTNDAGLRRQALAALNSGHKLLAQDPFWHATHIGAMLAAAEKRDRQD